MTTVGVLGESVALDAVRAALGDAAAETVAVDPAAIGRVDAAALAGPVGSAAFERATAHARESRTPLVSIELGGIGGRPVAGVEAAISGYAPGTACHACLRSRVEATDPATDDGAYDAATARFAGAVAGRELASLVSGRESALLGGVIEVPHAQRRVLSVPYCECGDPGSKELPRHHEDRSLEESISMAEVAFDDRVGPITSIGEAESFPVPYYLATLAETPFSDGDAPDHAAGVGLDWDPAFMKALGEALERYSAAIYRSDDFETEPVNPIEADRFVRPEWPEADPVGRWHVAEHLATGETVQLPAELVVFPPPERTIRPAITTGLGLGNGGVDALLSGLYEVVERDATMVAWYSTYEPMGLVVDDDGYRTLAARAKSEGLEATALLLTQDVDVPVVAACVHREGEWPRFAAGSAADLDPAVAARGALEEAIQNWLELRRMGEDRAESEGGAIGTHAAFPETTREFVAPETTIPVDSVGPADLPSGADELERLVARVRDAGLDAYAARLTPRDVESMGFEVVRVVIPSAQPLFIGDPYFGERARSVPESLGFEPVLDRTYHPFP
ncbi:YcaO-like family protein [Natronomonas salsuginis]|uniref:Bacteriocin biosynthesis protein SagD n=1 Tax=Natronomonas salsuginis TaxID=2217661 RepID=A0A4U5J7N5_9EURY|nr:YcaO-like family protein [Natronomonas salsuginis]TKR24674.1 bacteriocin biosynthesis protein SagD [Natronomonas salsuginis]